MNGQVLPGIPEIDPRRRARAGRRTLIRRPKEPIREATRTHLGLMVAAWLCCSLAFSLYYAAIPGFNMHPCPPAFTDSLSRANLCSVAGLLLSTWLCTREALWDRIGGVLSALCGIGIWLVINAH